MREMKMIVEYIVEHKTYKDIKGRKMWVDFANSQVSKFALFLLCFKQVIYFFVWTVSTIN